MTAAAAPPAAAPAEHGAPAGAAPLDVFSGSPQERLARAARALEAGDADAALNLYEVVSGEGEFIEAEIGQVRAALANGETRKAVAYGSRVADENRDSLEAQLWLVYLVDRTGKPEFALENLDRMKAGDARETRLLATLRAELLIDRGRAEEALQGLDALAKGNSDSGVEAMRRRALRALGRPLGGAATVPGGPAAWPSFYSEPQAALRDATVAAAGVTIDGGRRVLTRLAVAPGTAVWIRNGLGLVRPGIVEALPGAPAVTVVRLTTPFPAEQSLAPDAYARAEGTRFCFTLGNRVADPERRSPPAVYPGIVFRKLSDGPYAAVTADTAGDLAGAPVFDAWGRLVGLGAGPGKAIGHPEAVAVAVATESFGAALGLSVSTDSADAADSGNRPRPTVVELHERLTPSVVAVFAAPTPRRETPATARTPNP